MIETFGITSTVLKMGSACFLCKSSASYFIVYTRGSSLVTPPDIITDGVIVADVVTVAPSSLYDVSDSNLTYLSPFSDKVGAVNDISWNSSLISNVLTDPPSTTISSVSVITTEVPLVPVEVAT